METGELLFGSSRAVTDVIDAPRQGVNGRHGLTLRFAKKSDPVGEVLGLLTRDTLAPLVGVLYVHADLRGSGRSALARCAARERLVGPQ